MSTNEEQHAHLLLICPECHGLLWEIKEGDLVRYRCHVGHAFTLEALEAEQATELDRALASALRALDERIHVVHRLADEARKLQHDSMVRRWEIRVREYEKQAGVIRAALMAKLPENGEQRPGAAEREETKQRPAKRE